MLCCIKQFHTKKIDQHITIKTYGMFEYVKILNYMKDQMATREGGSE
jgi:hypothetical protein